jgi:pimeloyl-ACP methyl ester carboxylesterase
MIAKERGCLVAASLVLGACVVGEQPQVGERQDAVQGVCGHNDSGELVSYELIASYTRAQLQAHLDEYVEINTAFGYLRVPLPADIDHGADTYKVTYCTLDADLADQPGGRRITTATGNLTVPRRSGPKHVVLYNHGTSVSYYDAPSNPSTFDSFEGPPATAIYAGGGFILIAPDYIGLGDSRDVPHRYFHAQTEASSTVDMWRASTEVLCRLDVEVGDRLFIMGFSQGGHTAFAALRQLQDEGVEVTAMATTGSVLAPEKFFLFTLDSVEEGTFLPLYGTYMLAAYDVLYDLYASPSEAFRPAYAPIVGDLFDMTAFWDDVVAGLGPTLKQTLRPSFHRQARRRDSEIRARLRDNAVDDWDIDPRTPIREYHSREDEEVAYDETIESIDQLRARGADITVKTAPAGHNHLDTWYRALPRTVTWFRRF